MDESAQRLRSHVQVIVSLINLHAQYIDSVNVADFVKKLRMRIELIAVTLPITIEAAPQTRVVVETFETIAKIVSEIYDPEKINVFELDVEDLPISALALATAAQIFAEFLSNIYARARPGAPDRVVARLCSAPMGRIALGVRADRQAPDGSDAPLDLLTSRIVQELTRSVEGEARFDAHHVRDASLVFPASADAPRVAPG